MQTKMEVSLYIIILLLTLTSCSNRPMSKSKDCDCCIDTYTNFSEALNCILQTQDKKSTSDQRLLLIAIVNSEVKKNQKLGWDIIKDTNIISIARQNYLLITIDQNNFQLPIGLRAPEFLEILNRHIDELFFVITNRDLYPFADWTENERKDLIIDRLKVGNGP